MDKASPDFWRSVKPDTTITLTDAQALRENVLGQSYIVDEVMKVTDLEGICEWLFFRMRGEGDIGTACLMVKIVGKDLDLRIYFEDSESFDPGNREDMCDNDCLWIFQPPDDEDDFEHSELEYAKSIGWDFPGDKEGDPEIHVDYNVKAGEELQGKVIFDPPQDGQRDLVATIVEYGTSDETTCPEMLFIEVGRFDLDEGGLIRMMFGNPVSAEEVDALAVTA